MINNTTALITGGAGFIGSHLSKRLISLGYRVIVVDNLLTGVLSNLDEISSNPNFTFVKEDVTLCDFDRLGQIDFIYHLASPASPNPRSKISYLNYPLETIRTNTIGTNRLLELAKKHRAKFLFASTSEVYGNPTIHPQPESYFGNVNTLSLRACYDESKRLGETVAYLYFKKFGVDARIVRIFNTYGPSMNPDDGRVVVNFINQALENRPITVYGDGSYTRSFCYISDLVAGLIKAMENNGTAGEAFNLGNPHEVSVLELATLIKKLTHSQSMIIFEEKVENDVEKRKPDISKSKMILGWEPEVSLEKGLRETIRFYKKIKHNKNLTGGNSANWR